MDTLGVLIVGAGAFMAYEAWKNATPTPIKKARSFLSSSLGSGSSSSLGPQYQAISPSGKLQNAVGIATLSPTTNDLGGA